MKFVLSLFLVFMAISGFSQKIKLKNRAMDAMNGTEFSLSIRDSTISLAKREEIIYREIRSGNILDFYRKLSQIKDTIHIEEKTHTISYFVLPDFLAIGSNEDYFYCPMRPQLAQKVANLLKCSLPTRKISDRIYQNADVKMIPQPIPPSKEMVTVPVFEKHNSLVGAQRKLSLSKYPLGALIAGNKKDVVISNKIFNEEGQLRVVIYGWHKADGKAIQPLYNGHSTLHVDYSHGIRMVQTKVWLDGKKTSLQKVLASSLLYTLLSDEGQIEKAYYPTETKL